MTAKSTSASSAQGTGDEPRRTSVGRYLASQREMRGITLEELAARTRIPGRNLERLESGSLDGAPDGFSRGLVRIVAEALGLDPDDAVMRLIVEPTTDAETLKRSARNARLASLGLLASAALLAVLVWKLLASWFVPSADADAPERVYRRDPVRALAAEQAALATGKPVASPRDSKSR
ncbi:MAG: helix-turn-helix transcriptional regulator [Myxococcota bacterium]